MSVSITGLQNLKLNLFLLFILPIKAGRILINNINSHGIMQ